MKILRWAKIHPQNVSKQRPTIMGVVSGYLYLFRRNPGFIRNIGFLKIWGENRRSNPAIEHLQSFRSV